MTSFRNNNLKLKNTPSDIKQLENCFQSEPDLT